MAKIADTNEKIAKAVVKGYKAIEDAVVGGYKAVEGAFVGGYKRVEDGFVDTFLAKEGETVEEAKRRVSGGAPNKK